MTEPKVYRPESTSSTAASASARKILTPWAWATGDPFSVTVSADLAGT
jgi:hypothetical protein